MATNVQEEAFVQKYQAVQYLVDAQRLWMRTRELHRRATEALQRAREIRQKYCAQS